VITTVVVFVIETLSCAVGSKASNEEHLDEAKLTMQVLLPPVVAVQILVEVMILP